jgi:hypothetical protein
MSNSAIALLAIVLVILLVLVVAGAVGAFVYQPGPSAPPIK